MNDAERIEQPQYDFHLSRTGALVAVGKFVQGLWQVAGFGSRSQAVAVGLWQPGRGVA